MNRNPDGLTRFRSLWLVGSLGYGALRIALAGAFLTDYGLDIRVFALIELSSSVILGLCSGMLIESIVRAQRGKRLALMAGTTAGYAAPDLYVLAYSGSFPTSTLIVVCGIAIVGLVATLISVARRWRRLSANDPGAP